MNIEKEELIKKYSRFRNSSIWREIKEMMQSKIDELELQIHTIGKNEVKYSEKDLAILTIKGYKDMIDYPDNVIRDNQVGENMRVDDLDPYND